MKKETIRKILTEHKKWLADSSTGKRADFRGANFRGANFRYADFRYADLRHSGFYKTHVRIKSTNTLLSFKPVTSYHPYTKEQRVELSNQLLEHVYMCKTGE